MIQSEQATARALRVHAEAEARRRAKQAEERDEPDEPGVSLTMRLVLAIEDSGGKTPDELADMIDADPSRVLSLLHRHLGSGRITRRDGMYVPGEGRQTALLDALRPMIRRWMRDGYKGTDQSWQRLARIAGVERK